MLNFVVFINAIKIHSWYGYQLSDYSLPGAGATVGRT